MNRVPELLAPAGTMEKLRFALAYGADAVYIGIKGLSLRAGAGNFAPGEVGEAVEAVHEAGARLYVALNVFAGEAELEAARVSLPHLKAAGVDAIIVADPGIFALIRRDWPDARVHISTQANILNSQSAGYWLGQGAARVTLARELSLKQIEDIKRQVSGEVEVFVHGSMCMAYAGRCYLSKYMAGRDANSGDCAHSCRWKYYLTEEKRRGDYFPVDTDGNQYLFNSRDLCLAARVPELVGAGVDSLKIEGRMKSLHYLATVTGVYRRILDDIAALGTEYRVADELLEELAKVSHRGYTEGFIDGDWSEDSWGPSSASYIRDYDFVGVVARAATANQPALVEVRNRLSLGDSLEVVRPRMETLSWRLKNMTMGGLSALEAHANSTVELWLPPEVGVMSILRRPSESRVEAAV